MYIYVQELKALNFSKRKAGKILAIHRDTVSNYWDMTEDEYAEMIKHFNKSQLVKYEPVILGWLNRYPTMTAAQVYDWLEEHYSIEMSESAVRRYVRKLRMDHGITKISTPREYESVEELQWVIRCKLILAKKV